MAWIGFDGHPYTRDEFAAHVALTRWTDWRPKGLTLHNTAAPRLDQWVESGPSHDARIRNLENYYETQLGWHAGPHLFISRDYINGFSDLTQPGVHSRCYNATHLGIEMVGDYNVEEFDSGDGAKVRDTTVFALATLYQALGLDPVDLVFHKECAIDNHDCPGHKVVKGDVIARVIAAIAGTPTADGQTSLVARNWKWTQTQLRIAGLYLGEIDGDPGPKTEAAVSQFIQMHTP